MVKTCRNQNKQRRYPSVTSAKFRKDLWIRLTPKCGLKWDRLPHISSIHLHLRFTIFPWHKKILLLQMPPPSHQQPISILEVPMHPLIHSEPPQVLVPEPRNMKKNKRKRHSHVLHVWNIYHHLPHKWPKCR